MVLVVTAMGFVVVAIGAAIAAYLIGQATRLGETREDHTYD